MSDRDVDTIREALNWSNRTGLAQDAVAALDRVADRLAASVARPAADEALRAMLTAIENHGDPKDPTGTRKLIVSWNLRAAMDKARAALSGPPGTAREDADEALREALRHYADENHWLSCEYDGGHAYPGEVARAALRAAGEQEQG